MLIPNRIFRMLAALCAGACAAPSIWAAQGDPASNYPARPIRFIAPFAPGAGTDTTARSIGAKLSEAWGQQVVVDNRTGAAGAIGVDLTKSGPLLSNSVRTSGRDRQMAQAGDGRRIAAATVV